MQIGVLNRSSLADPDVALWTDACDRQLQELCAAWSIPYQPVIFYSSADGLPVASGAVRLLTIQDRIDVPGAAGYHQNLFGLILSRVQANGEDTAVTMAHEIGEQTVNPFLDKWAPMPGSGLEVAMEVADPVQETGYEQHAKIGFLERQVYLSNYVLPSYFDRNGKPPYDRMGLVTHPFEILPNGYVVVRDADGDRSSVFARPRVTMGAGPAAAGGIAAHLVKPESRIIQLLRG